MNNKNILVIDDSDGDHLLTEIAIEKYNENITIVKAYDGEEAIEILKNVDKKPDFILLDINMAGVTGHEFLDEYHNQLNLDIPIAMVSSSIQDREKEITLKYTYVKTYIEKPIDVNKIKKILSITND